MWHDAPTHDLRLTTRANSDIEKKKMQNCIHGGEAEIEEYSSTEDRVDRAHRRFDDFSASRGKVVDIARSIGDKVENGELFFSIELLSGKLGVDKKIYESFVSEINQHEHLDPLFYALTWHEKSARTADNFRRFEILESFPKNTLLHVVANNLKKSAIVEILDEALAQGKTNIFALRGDGYSGIGDFSNAANLVKFIRKRYSSEFTICVAGYPQMHPESTSKESDLIHLKKKVDAGADFIITQIFFESEVFIDFVRDCRDRGIEVPIIPGIFPIPSLKSLRRMAELCGVEVPRKILEDLRPFEDNNNEDAIYTRGVALARKLIREIFESGTSSGFHLFTINRASIALDVSKDVLKQSREIENLAIPKIIKTEQIHEKLADRTPDS